MYNSIIRVPLIHFCESFIDPLYMTSLPMYSITPYSYIYLRYAVFSIRYVYYILDLRKQNEWKERKMIKWNTKQHIVRYFVDFIFKSTTLRTSLICWCMCMMTVLPAFKSNLQSVHTMICILCVYFMHFAYLALAYFLEQWITYIIYSIS